MDILQATTITQLGGKIYVSSTDTDTDTNTTYSAGSGITLSGTTFSNSAPDQTVSFNRRRCNNYNRYLS
jgi:hypothetical protein